MQLYKGRYLIAIYDIHDRFVECSNALNNFLHFTEVQVVSMTRKDRRDTQQHKYYKAYLIDCLEPHDDCFAEEDEIFLKEEAEIQKYIKTLPKPKYIPTGRSNAQLQEKAKIVGHSIKFLQQDRKRVFKTYRKKKNTEKEPC